MSKGVLVAIISISLYYVYAVNAKKIIPLYFKSLNILLVLITLYGIFRLGQGDWSHGSNPIYNYSYLKVHLMSILPIYSFYVFTRKRLLTNRFWILTIIAFGTLSIFFFVRTYLEVSKMTGLTNITNNSAYMFVALVALLPLLKIKLSYKYILLALLGVFVLMSAKRGAILVYALCLLEFVWFSVRRMPRSARIRTMIGSLITVGIGCYLAIYYIDTNEYLSLRLAETERGSSTGRDVLFGSLIRHFTRDLSNIHLFFGNGADSTFLIAGNFAHNDWLEFVTNMGVVGLLVYLFYWLCFYLTYRQLPSYSPTSCAFLVVMTICFMRTWYSMSINDMFVVMTMVIGYCIGEKENNEVDKIWQRLIR